jgi:hypothetical protein
MPGYGRTLLSMNDPPLTRKYRPPIVVVIKDESAGVHGFRQKLLRRCAVFVFEIDAGLRCDTRKTTGLCRKAELTFVKRDDDDESEIIQGASQCIFSRFQIHQRISQRHVEVLNMYQPRDAGSHPYRRVTGILERFQQ